MELLHNGFMLDTPPGTFPLSTDSMVLSDFVRLPKNACVLDLGSGCGTLGILLCSGDPACSVTGIEIDENAHLAALENIQQNRLQDHMKSICADLRSVSSLIPAGSCTTCVSNPPYFTGGPASCSLPVARRDDFCEPDALFAAAAWALRFGGDFYLVHKPEKLALLCTCANKHNLEPKRLRLVRHRPVGDVALILLQCRKGAKPGMQWDEICLFHPDGTPTEHYQRIYHLQEEHHGRNAVFGTDPHWKLK